MPTAVQGRIYKNGESPNLQAPTSPYKEHPEDGHSPRKPTSQLGAQARPLRHNDHPSAAPYHPEDLQLPAQYLPQANDYGQKQKHSGPLHESGDSPRGE